MTLKIILEIIDQINCLVKQFFIRTAVHEDRLRTKHLRYFREDRRSFFADQYI